MGRRGWAPSDAPERKKVVADTEEPRSKTEEVGRKAMRQVFARFLREAQITEEGSPSRFDRR